MEFSIQEYILAHKIRDDFKKQCLKSEHYGLYDPIDLVCFVLKFVSDNPEIIKETLQKENNVSV